MIIQRLKKNSKDKKKFRMKKMNLNIKILNMIVQKMMMMIKIIKIAKIKYHRMIRLNHLLNNKMEINKKII